MEIASLVASLASIIIAGFAIWLSVAFYKMSSAAQQASDETNRQVRSGVNKLESLFNSMYADTFSLVRDSYQAMHRRAWEEVKDEELGGGSAGQKAAQQGQEPGPGARPEESTHSSHAGEARGGGFSTSDGRPPGRRAGDGAVTSVGEEPLTSQQREQLKEVVKGVLERIWAAGKTPTPEQVQVAGEQLGYSYKEVLRALFFLRRDGVIHHAGDFGPNTELFRTKEEADKAYEKRIDKVVGGVIDDSTPF